jgi:hypothetical protein
MPNLLTPLKKLMPFRRPIVIKRSTKTHISEQGWRLTYERGMPQMEGWYRSKYGSWRGFIRDLDSSKPSFYIVNPPQELTNHPYHGNCFGERKRLGKGVFSVHFKIKPGDLDSGVLNIERTLNESFVLSKKTA